MSGTFSIKEMINFEVGTVFYAIFVELSHIHNVMYF